NLTPKLYCFWSILNLASKILKFLKPQLGTTRLSSLILGQAPSLPQIDGRNPGSDSSVCHSVCGHFSCADWSRKLESIPVHGLYLISDKYILSEKSVLL
ncbi:MAG: hypothetical protein PHD43_20385, partial [Methylococcales bacterium]|nr:hypothetical protein [Methylococcales bacterium]